MIGTRVGRFASVLGAGYLSVCLSLSDGRTQAEDGPAEGRAGDAGGLAKYVVDYPVADQFCPPIRPFFFVVTQRGERINGRFVRYKPNGGYGLPVVDKLDGKNLLHLGADVGWRRISEPVFAVANGVVRLSAGPVPPDPNRRSGKSRRPPPEARSLPWGNLVVIEHRLPDSSYVTTVYGHLASQRRVRTGEIVKAGQMIGAIGKQHPAINGGYLPHLHFGVRTGRSAEIGATLMELQVNGVKVPAKIAAVDSEHLEIDLPPGTPERIRLERDGVVLSLDKNADGRRLLPSRILWSIHRPGFDLVGYGLSLEGWNDPAAFLRARQADTRPARFLPPLRRRP